MTDTIETMVSECINTAIKKYTGFRFRSYKHLCDYYNRLYSIFYIMLGVTLGVLFLGSNVLVTDLIDAGNEVVAILAFVVLAGVALIIHNYVGKWLTKYYSNKISDVVNHPVYCDDVTLNEMFDHIEAFTEKAITRPTYLTILQLQSILLIYKSIEKMKERQVENIKSII